MTQIQTSENPFADVRVVAEAPAPAPADAPTDKQVAFLTRLADEREVEIDFASLTKRTASREIDRLLSLPKKNRGALRPVSTEVAPEGFHKVGDEIYKVQIAVHGSGKAYAKRLVPDSSKASGFGFEYAPGAISRLSTETLLTLEEAKEFGRLYGVCCVCAATLTDDRSIEAGIGPICAGKF